MTSAFDEDAVRNWLVDYLVTNIGCSPEEIDLDAPLNDLAVGSSDAVVLTGELSELLGRTVSPVEFWQYPTINALARFLTGGEVEIAAEAVPTHHGPADEAIAVIGLGLRFPGGINSAESMWEFLSDGRSAVGEVPASRWDWFDDGTPESGAALAGTTKWGSFLDDIAQFDAEFFEISPSEADNMDPQQRMLLEVAYEAFEHAGIRPDALRHTQTGVFTGACLSEYGVMASMNLSEVGAYSGTGGALSIISNRVSYFFDLRGPSVTVDTACSSSLVAVHLAAQSLLAGDSDLALAAGVNVVLSPAVTRSFDQAEAMSSTGRCHSFDARADGFVRGEGCGVAVLKRLSDAQRDGNRVLAIIRGSAVNQDGRSNGLMAPNPAAQMAVLRAAYASAGVEPRDVDYVEAHGTGTLLGDPIEARALGSVLGRGRSADAPLLIGSIKSNLGHTEAAAGVAGLAKTVLALQHRRVPANYDYQTPNPHIAFADMRLKVVDTHTDMPHRDRPLLAGVSSFGFGGTNAHVVIEQAPAAPQASPPTDEPTITTLVVSGKTPQRISASAASLAEWMSGPGAEVPLSQVASTLNYHRAQHAKFASVCARSRADAVAGLQALGAGQSGPGVAGPQDGAQRHGTVFVYSGQGSQWLGMGRQLLVEEPAFAAALAEIEPTFREQVGFSLYEVISNGEEVTGIDRIQPVLVGLQLALTQLWNHHGVHPDAVIGHSMGEVAASVVAGALSVADGLKVIATRSRLMSALSGQGAMALLELDSDSALEFIADYSDITLAVYASPRHTVIAGPPEQIDAAITAISARDLLARRIEVDVASHHPTVDPILPELRTALADLKPSPVTIPMIVTTGGRTGTVPTCDAEYWVDNLRNPVRFYQAVAEAGSENGTFVEISPHPLLTYSIDDTVGTAHHRSLPTLLRDSDETLAFHVHLNSMRTVRPTSSGPSAEVLVDLPATPWQHSRHWVAERGRDRRVTGTAPRPGTLLGEQTAVMTTPPTQVWQSRLVKQGKPYPGFHRIQGVEVVPMSVLLRTLTVAAAEVGATTLSDLRFERPIVIDKPQVVQVVINGDAVTMSSAPEAHADVNRWVRHATARLSPPAADESDEETSGKEAQYDRNTIEKLQTKWGVEGQPFPWSITSCEASSAWVRAQVDYSEAAPVAVLDAAIQIARLADITDERLLVPAAIESVSMTGDFAISDAATTTVRRRPGNHGDLLVDVGVTVPTGEARLDVRGLRYIDVEASGPSTHQSAHPRDIAHKIDWQPWAAPESAETHAGMCFAVAGATREAEVLAQMLAGAGYTTSEDGGASCIIYTPDVTKDDESDLDCAARLTREVADLVGQLASRNSGAEGRLWIVTNGVRETASRQALRQSCLWGLAGVINAEEPQVWGGLVDVQERGVDPADATLLASLFATPAKTILALRGGQLYEQTLAEIAGEADSPPAGDPLRCRADGAYLITGGMGALGLLTAGWLADRGARRLVLAGRTALPPRSEWGSDQLDADTADKISAIRALEALGVAVEIAVVDIGSVDCVTAMVKQRDQDGAPPIRGIVHAAGVTDSQLLTDLSEDRLRDTLWPKVAGASVLDEVFPPGSLDFLHFTASAGTIFGVPGQGAYAAANAYLDGLARARHPQDRCTVSLDWVAWQGLGFGSDAQVVVDELGRRGSRPLMPDEAFEAWEYLSRFEIAHAVMAPMVSGVERSGSSNSAAETAPTLDWSQMSGDEILVELENGLRAIIATELRTSENEVDSDVPFAEIGLNSVMAMSIRREVERLTRIELSATILWNHPTIASLAAHLAEKVAPGQVSHTEDEQEDDSDSLLDSLFDSVESTTSASEDRT